MKLETEEKNPFAETQGNHPRLIRVQQTQWAGNGMGVEKDPPLFFLSYFAYFLVFLCFSFGISCVWASNLTIIINAIALSHGT